VTVVHFLCIYVSAVCCDVCQQQEEHEANEPQLEQVELRLMLMLVLLLMNGWMNE